MGIRIIILATLWVLMAPLSVQAQDSVPADVRLLVDISGSMKQTDPNNLRIPALELMVKLLPEDTQAGVWSFGRQVNMLVPFDSVDDAWRQQAQNKTGQINSVGLFTNIGEALEKASAVAPKSGMSSLVLLTDGKVDIDKKASRNAQERQRILSELLPELKRKGFTIHTIALSNDADTELLQQLSRTTDGVYSVAETADELMQSYLLMFDQAVPAKRLPLSDNRFQVDSSVDEFTALIFRQPDSSPTQLIDPAGNKINSAQHPNTVSWYGADSYDLITVHNPKTGQWQVVADETPQNRVTVVSDLELRVAELPNNVIAGNELPVEFGLYEKGEVITDPDFLNLLTARAEITPVGEPGRWQLPLPTDPIPAGGVFTETIPKFKQRGDFDLTIVVDGKTFAREFKHRVKVDSLFDVQMDKRIENDQVHYDIVVRGDPNLINTELSAVVAHVKTSGGNSELETLSQTDIGRWVFSVTADEVARYAIDLQASGEDADGNAFDENLPSLYFTYPEQGDPILTEADKEIQALKQLLAEEKKALAAETNQPEPTLPEEQSADSESSSLSASSSSAPQVQAAATSQIDSDSKPEEDREEGGTDWLMILAIAGGNVLLAAMVYFVYRQFSTKDVQSELDEFEQALQQNLEGEDKPETTPQAATKPAPAVDDDDPLAALDALSVSAPDSDEMFPVDDTKNNAGDIPMDELDNDPDSKP
ncbi:VWA domain-containing protein [Gilvimarinus agarilyticus]|uniref:VWA domain-containing protein n=1 Tax=Gilvimarinus sp. 2_MG-2023 TaxID=3062666 RepID=UPI001C084278|nr:VWA domain-containing protein [Gilvimarinus sp. 2_MG-2023]MBU2885945.1 VWA domain-containing protein [Gilvimarinus agarilyticus]MDO6570691.1 VWA domain-containing protein [Gilvimarinus sp. 2_MG-2023]